MDEKRKIIYTTEECIGCNKCIRVCPVTGANNVGDKADGNYILVDKNRCIHCGRCLKGCEHDARRFNDDCETFFGAIARGEKIDLLIAPSFFFNYPDKANQIIGYLRELGIRHIYNVGEAANITTWAYMSYYKETGKRGMISSACPVVVDYIEKYLPEIIDNIAPIQSPVSCMATAIKKFDDDRERKFAFLCPCLGKIEEYSSYPNGFTMDYTITFSNFLKYLEAGHVELANFNGVPDSLNIYGLGKYYPVPGGLAGSVGMFLSRDEVIRRMEGKDIFEYLKYTYKPMIENNDELPAFLDVLNCEGGCLEGVAADRKGYVGESIYVDLYKKGIKEASLHDESPYELTKSPQERFELLDKQMKALGLDYHEFMRAYNKQAFLVDKPVSDFDVERAFNMMHKFTEAERKINCTACGYKGCNQMAKAIARGLNRPTNCIHYMHGRMREDRASLERLLRNIQGDLYKPGGESSVEYLTRAVQVAINDIESERERISNSAQAKTSFFSSMTHELRTPLNAILNMTQTLVDADAGDEVSAAANSIKTAGEGLLEIVNELLDMSKIEAGRFSIVEDLYDVDELMGEIGTITYFRAMEKKLRYYFNVEPTLPAELIGDRKRIRQILLNLLGNATKFTKEGSVGLEIEWNNDFENPVIRFSVKDTGCGIKQEDIPYLFDAYTQADIKKNHNIEGTGLGLSISKNLVQEMGGSITVHSEYGVGSTFIVEIPQKMKEYRKIEIHAHREEKHYFMPDVRLLLVDDTSINITVARNMLEDYCIGVIDSAESGKEAVELCRNNQYDIILIDYKMPEMDGAQTLNMIRTGDGLNTNTPTVFMSAEDQRVFRDEVNIVFEGYLEKPIVKKELEHVLQKYIPREKLITISGKVTIPVETFVTILERDDFEKYLNNCGIIEYIALNKQETGAMLMARTHRQELERGNYTFIRQNASYLDALRERMLEAEKMEQ